MRTFRISRTFLALQLLDVVPPYVDAGDERAAGVSRRDE
jgi:hypothetical protein